MVPKVFCIGFHKTGTTSLGRALREFGYSVTGPNGVRDPNIRHNVYPMAYRLAERFDAFQDNPWPVLYRQMDQRYPSSKFILTVRAPDLWIRSQVRHFGTKTTPMREWIYGLGCPEGNEAAYVKRFEQHNRDVVSYFSERRDDFLVMALADGDGWEKLSPFLGKKAPSIPFPHSNKANSRETEKKPWRRLLSHLR